MTTEQKFKAAMRELGDKLWALVEKRSEQLAAQALATAKANLRGILEGFGNASTEVDVDEGEEREDSAPARRALPAGDGRSVGGPHRGRGGGGADRVDSIRARASKAEPGKPTCSKCGKTGHNARTCGRAALPADDAEDEEGEGQLFPPQLIAPRGGVAELANAYRDVLARPRAREAAADPEEESHAPTTKAQVQAPPPTGGPASRPAPGAGARAAARVDARARPDRGVQSPQRTDAPPQMLTEPSRLSLMATPKRRRRRKKHEFFDKNGLPVVVVVNAIQPQEEERLDAMSIALDQYPDAIDIDEHGNRLPPIDRPHTRAECKDGPRPCPWISCRHHMALNITNYGYLAVEHVDFFAIADTCNLDIAERGEHTLEEVGDRFQLTRQRMRQIETKAFAKAQLFAKARGLEASELALANHTKES